MNSDKCKLDNWETEVKFLTEARDSSLTHSVRTGFVNYLASHSVATWGKTARAVRSKTQTSTFAMWPVIYFGNTKQKDKLQCMHQRITQWTVLLHTCVSVANCRCVYLVHYIMCHPHATAASWMGYSRTSCIV